MATGRRILIVEDDPYTRDVIATALRGLGYDVTGAARLSQGIEAARAVRPHLLICDVVLPDGSGVELARALRAEMPAAELPVVVLMSAFSKGRLADQRAMKEASGAVAFVSKPFAVAQLLDLIAQHVPLPPDIGAAGAPGSRERPASPAPPAEEPAPPSQPLPQPATAARESRPAAAEPLGPAGAAAWRPAAGPPAVRTDTGLFAALATAWRKGWSGTLAVARPSAQKRIVVEGGRIVWATSSLTDERFGRVVLRLGWLQPEQYEPTLQEAARTGRRHGEVLVARGLITPAQLDDALREQIEQVVVGALGWPEGTYRVQALPGQLGGERVVTSPIPRLVLRAFREVVAAERLDAYLAAAGERPIVQRQGVPAAAVAQLELAPEEQRVLAALEIPLPLEAALSAHPRGPEAARPLLAALLALGLLVPVEPTGRPAAPLAAAARGRPAPARPVPAPSPALDPGERLAAETAAARLLEAEAAFDAGRRAAEQGDLAAAQAALDRAVALCPDEGEYVAWAAWTRALAARIAFDRTLDRAIVELEAAARLTPSCEAIFGLVERVLRLRGAPHDGEAC